MSRFLVMCFSLLMQLWPYLLLPVPIIYFWRRNRRWVPKSTGRSLSVRNFEAALFLVVLLLMGVVWLYDGTPRVDVPSKFGERVSDTIRGYNSQAAILGSICGVIAVAVAWRFSTTLSVAVLMITGLIGVFSMDSKIHAQRDVEREAESALRSNPTTNNSVPVKLRFELINRIPGADIWMNGVHLGKTPFETTSTELMSKLPPWEHENVNPLRYPQTESNSYTTPQGDSLSNWGWCPLHFPVSNPNSTKLYYKIELNGVTGFSHLVRQTTEGESNSPTSVIVVTFDTVFPAWESEIEDLLDRARLNAYEVDAAWLAAFDSYGDFAKQQLDRAILAEPPLKKILEQRARIVQGLTDVKDAASAWAHLMRIEEEARSSHHYDSSSDAGVAVDLLVPMLDPQQLVDHAIHLLNATSKIDPSARSYGNERFATHNGDGSTHGEEVGLWPIAQAIWRLDQRLDAEDDSKTPNYNPTDISKRGLFAALHPDLDNIAEQRITPLIMKLSYGNTQRLEYAALLGGSAYEEFLLRNDWRRIATEGWGDDLDVGDSQNYVNGWFYKLASLRSPLGTAFRDQQSDAILKLCRNGLSDHSTVTGSFPTEMDFLFIDREFSKKHPSLAMRFWPDLDGHAKGQSSHSQTILQLRWDYLARLWPESTPQMFLSALREANNGKEHVNVPLFPKALSADARFHVFTTILDAETKRVATIVDDPENLKYSGPKYQGNQLLNQLPSQLRWLPCEAAARQLLNELKADSKHEAWGQLSSVLSYNRQNEDLLRLMAESGDSKLELMTLPAIERHPVQSRVELLERLLTAEASEVRSAANVVSERLDELRQRQLTPRAGLELH